MKKEKGGMTMANQYVNSWSEEEITFLIENYCKHGINYCCEHLNRSKSAILHKAHRMKLRRRGIGRDTRYHICDGYLVRSDVNNNKVFIHREVMEQKIGRPLTSKDIVHHIDGDKLNNDPDNLLLTDKTGHQRIHNRNRNEKGQFI